MTHLERRKPRSTVGHQFFNRQNPSFSTPNKLFSTVTQMKFTLISKLFSRQWKYAMDFPLSTRFGCCYKICETRSPDSNEICELKIRLVFRIKIHILSLFLCVYIFEYYIYVCLKSTHYFKRSHSPCGRGTTSSAKSNTMCCLCCYEHKT
jgi:hypothetical protein